MSPLGFSKLLPYVGKKVVWIGWDDDAEASVIMFEDKTAIMLTDAEVLEDVEAFVKKTLEMKLPDAKQIMSLQEMFKEEKKDEPAGN